MGLRLLVGITIVSPTHWFGTSSRKFDNPRLATVLLEEPADSIRFDIEMTVNVG